MFKQLRDAILSPPPQGGAGIAQLAQQTATVEVGPNNFQASYVFDLGGPATWSCDATMTAVNADGETFGAGAGELNAVVARIVGSSDGINIVAGDPGAWDRETDYDGSQAIPYMGWKRVGITARYVIAKIEIVDVTSFEPYAGANHPTATFNLAVTYTGGSGGDPAIVTPFGPQVFEVTDLLIPAGTDWTGLGHELGSFEVPSASLLLFKVYLEVSEPTSDDLFLDISDVPDYTTSFTPVEVHVEAGDASALWNTGSNWLPNGQQGSPTATSLAHGADLLLGGSSKFANRDVAPDATQTYTANLHTGAITAADITVVRARASFLVV